MQIAAYKEVMLQLKYIDISKPIFRLLYNNCLKQMLKETIQIQNPD